MLTLAGRDWGRPGGADAPSRTCEPSRCPPLHATDDRDQALADALAVLATTAPSTALSVVREPVTDEIRTKSAESDGDEATITPLTSQDTE
jgi:hypothetical protein